MRVPASMRDAVSGIAGDHLDLRGQQLVDHARKDGGGAAAGATAEQAAFRLHVVQRYQSGGG